MQRHYNAFMHEQDTRAYLGVYGSIILPKRWCEDCEAFSFVRHGVTVCCAHRNTEAPQRWKRESAASGIRQKPTAEYAEVQLERQAHRCFYCFYLFSSSIHYKKRLVMLRVCWDHVVPFAYLQSNPNENFVAACQICNGIKSSKVFQTVAEARNYVQVKREIARKAVR